MGSVIQKLEKRGLITPPKWLSSNTCYETIMGSTAYGVNSDMSDFDIYGFAIPPKSDVFPHLRGEIPGFGLQKQRFAQYQQHHIEDKQAMNGFGRMYDMSIYSIVKYFQLVMENNPNMIDSLYTPIDCIVHITQIGQMVRDNRDMFLHKGCWHKFRGYAYAQLSKIKAKSKESKRYWMIEKYGYDCKFAYHVVRLVLEVEQILTEGTIDLRRNSDVLKAIRNGEWSESKLKSWFNEKEASLEPLYHASQLPYKPDQNKVKALLLSCLEQHYGSLSKAVTRPDKANDLIAELERIIEVYK